jgi:hypothetical protein
MIHRIPATPTRRRNNDVNDQGSISSQSSATITSTSSSNDNSLFMTPLSKMIPSISSPPPLIQKKRVASSVFFENEHGMVCPQFIIPTLLDEDVSSRRGHEDGTRRRLTYRLHQRLPHPVVEEDRNCHSSSSSFLLPRSSDNSSSSSSSSEEANSQFTMSTLSLFDLNLLNLDSKTPNPSPKRVSGYQYSPSPSSSAQDTILPRPRKVKRSRSSTALTA